MLRRDHPHQGGAIAQHQQISGFQKHPQVGAATIHIADRRLQGGRQLPPVTGGQHPREGEQRIAEEPRRQGRLHPPLVGGFRLPLTPAQVLLPPPRQQLPAVLHQLQPRQQRRQGGMQRPGGCIRGELGQSQSAAAGYCRCSPCAVPQSASEPEGMGELRQDVGAGWFSDPRTTRTVDEGRHNATAITAREDPLIVTLRLVIGKQSACRWGYRNHRISS